MTLSFMSMNVLGYTYNYVDPYHAEILRKLLKIDSITLNPISKQANIHPNQKAIK